jgi:uncharacterized protein (DUF433 family)
LSALAFGIVDCMAEARECRCQPREHLPRRATATKGLEISSHVDILFPGTWKDLEASMPTPQMMLMTANEAASVTGVPLRHVHRIIDAGLLEGAVIRQRKARLLKRNALIGLRLAHETADVLTAEGRRVMVAKLIRRPRQDVIRADAVIVDARPAAKVVRSGLDQLTKARRLVSSTPGVLRGTPVFKGTRIPVHDIADMLTNGNNPAAIVKAYPQLDKERVRLAAIYALAYPRRGRPPAKAGWRSLPPKTSETIAFDAAVRA